MESLLDPEALERLRGFGGEKLLRGMVELFVKNAPARVADARAAFDGGDAAALRSAFHALKSSAGQLGAVTVHRACVEGEQLAGKGQLAPCAEYVQLIERDLPRACDALKVAGGVS